jgi:hypothetical protein
VPGTDRPPTHHRALPLAGDKPRARAAYPDPLEPSRRNLQQHGAAIISIGGDQPNRSTQGYAARSPAWAAHLDDALADARFDRLRDLYDAHRRGEPVGFGPAADRLSDQFDSITAKIEAHSGDARVEYDLLRKAGITVRFGTLNHCTLDEANPIDAKCLENAIVPPGHHGPLVDRCQPARCPNSVLTPEHLPIWRTEEHNLLTLLDTPKLPPGRRAQLQRELDDVHIVIRKAAKP